MNESCDQIDDKNKQINGEKEVLPKIDLLHNDVKSHIKTHLEKQGFTDITIDVQIGSNLGDNFMGFIGKLTVTGLDKSEERKTFNWIIKTAPNLETYRSMMDITVAYERECLMYSEVFKVFRDFQHEKNILNPFDQHAGFILSYLENMKESLVMEDMKSLGYIMRPRQEPLDWDHVKLVMKAYAKLHALSYALKDQKPDVFKRLAESTPDIFNDTMMKEAVRQGQEPMLKLPLQALDPKEDVKLIPILQKFLDNYPEILMNLLHDTNDRSVIGHGDSWVNNMLWKYDSSNPDVPSKVCILDWQLARYGSPVCDLSYFIFTCTSKELRDRYYNDMIKLYYYTLCAHVNDLGTDPQKYLTFETLQEDLKKYSLVGFFTTILVLGIITRDTSEIPEWRSDDINVEEAQEKWYSKSKNSDIYNKRVRDVIVDFYEKGYFNNLL